MTRNELGMRFIHFFFIARNEVGIWSEYDRNLVGIRAIHDSHSPVGFGRLSRQKAHKLRAHGSNSSVGNKSTRIQVWISDRTQVPAGHGSPAILYLEHSW